MGGRARRDAAALGGERAFYSTGRGAVVLVHILISMKKMHTIFSLYGREVHLWQMWILGMLVSYVVFLLCCPSHSTEQLEWQLVFRC